MTRRKNIPFFKILTGVVILIVLHYLTILKPIESGFLYILRPFSGILHSLSSGITHEYRFFFNTRDLNNEIDQMKIRISTLEQENFKYKIYEKENEELRNTLNFKKNNNHKIILANIIAKPVTEYPVVKGVLIDKGINDGISQGLAVIDSNGIMLGKIIKTEDYISELCLVTQKDCEIAAMLKGGQGTSGIVSGELNLTTRMDYIPQTDAIRLNDIAVTSGLESIIPEGLIIGTVIKVFEENNAIWKSAIIEPMEDINAISIVSVIIK